jgi:glutathione synthase/RimK-type ligase-like ATP-grasp enzyme
VKRIRDPEVTAFVPRHDDVVINWGRSKAFPRQWAGRGWLFNDPAKVAIAADKLKTFEVLSAAGIKIPKFTTDPEVAKRWARKRIVFGRRLLRSSSGRGIEIYKRPEDVSDSCRLYVRYVPKRDEYRVHVFRGTVIDVQKKMRRSGVFTGDPDLRNMVRNYDNGWVFGRAGIAPPEDVITQATNAVAAIGLDFGAVDVGWTENIQQATVFEVNTAPGLVGTTLERYIRAFRRMIGGHE